MTAWNLCTNRMLLVKQKWMLTKIPEVQFKRYVYDNLNINCNIKCLNTAHMSTVID